MLEARGWAHRVAEERRLCTQAQSDFVEIEAEGLSHRTSGYER